MLDLVQHVNQTAGLILQQVSPSFQARSLFCDILDFRFHYLTKLKGGGVKEFFAKQVERQPIPFNSTNREFTLELDKLGLAMITARDELSSTQIEKEKQLLNSEIIKLKDEINECVVKLFNISSEELVFMQETKATWS